MMNLVKFYFDKIIVKITYLIRSESDQNSSESDNNIYPNQIRKIIENPRNFKNFKRDPIYRSILEHLSKKQGKDYLDWIRNNDRVFFDQICKGVRNDEVGNPFKYKYDNIKFSPSTLRYLKIGSEIKSLFNNDIGKNICEIGGGYGGQLVQLDSLFKINNYTIFDLPDVNKLITKYCEITNVKCRLLTKEVEEIDDTKYDFFISNYAFSELPKSLQVQYLPILKNSKRGYMIMNSGNGGIYDNKERLKIEQLYNELPNIKVIEENPLTYKYNYVIVWGLNI